MENKIMWLLSPNLRIGILDSLEKLADKELQLTKWMNSNRKYTFWNQLMFCINALFNDANALGKTSQIKVGLTVYNEEEVEKINKFCKFFDNLCNEEIGGQESDIAYFGHPQWQRVIEDAAELVEEMERNNIANNFDECLSQFNHFDMEEYEDYDDFADAENIKNGYNLWN